MSDLITKAEVTRTIEERIAVYRCSVCGAQFENNDQGELTARDHAKMHEPLIYLHPGNRYCDTVWIDEGALIKNSGPWKAAHEINHANKGRTSVDWIGPGWYVWHAYEFRHVDKAYGELREKLSEQADDLKFFRGLQKKGRP